MDCTEHQAREKWCSESRVVRDEIAHARQYGHHYNAPVLVGGTNRDAIGGVLFPASCRCLASDCMKWMWTDDVLQFERTNVGEDGECAPPAGEGWEKHGEPYHPNGYASGPKVQTWGRQRGDARRGTCGLVRGETTVNVEVQQP